MLDWIGWFFTNIWQALINFFWALTHPGAWLGWIGGLETPEDKLSLIRFIYYGGSVEFFFFVFVTVLIVTGIGILSNRFMWGVVRVLEGFANGLGRIFAWAGLFMVIQQIVIVFLQRIFRVSEITLGPGSPLGYEIFGGLAFLQKDLSWWSEELKLYNALIVTLCVSYTFIQGGHVRVDLVYSAVRFRTKRVIDMFGSLFFMMPAAVLVWLFAWFFMWRHLVTPKVAASDTFERLEAKARALRWNVETVGFSPNGFDAYFLFKLLIVAFTGLVFLQAVAFFYRSYLEFREGPESEDKYLDKDRLNDEEAELVADIH